MLPNKVLEISNITEQVHAVGTMRPTWAEKPGERSEFTRFAVGPPLPLAPDLAFGPAPNLK